jgi:hypothetical protein
MSSSNHGAAPRQTPIIATVAAATRLASQRRIGAVAVPAARFEKRFMRILALRRRVLRRAAVDQPARAAAPGGSDEQAELDGEHQGVVERAAVPPIEYRVPSVPEMNRQETSSSVDRHRQMSSARPRAAHGARALALDTPGTTPTRLEASAIRLEPASSPPFTHKETP